MNVLLTRFHFKFLLECILTVTASRLFLTPNQKTYTITIDIKSKTYFLRPSGKTIDKISVNNDKGENKNKKKTLGMG